MHTHHIEFTTAPASFLDPPTAPHHVVLKIPISDSHSYQKPGPDMIKGIHGLRIPRLFDFELFF